MKKTKVVVTGGAGFIGSHIVEHWIKAGAEVHIIDNLRTGFMCNVQLFPQTVFHKVSITEREKVFKILENADYVHHLAAMISVPESVDNPIECVEININGLLNVLDACKENGVKKIVFSSSAAVYGENPESPKRIDMCPLPKSPYGITKLDGEYYLQMYNEQYGLGAVSLRYFNVFGPRQDPKSQYAAAVPIFIDRALKNEPITIYGDGEQTRDFIFVKDVVKANMLAAANLSVNGIFNVASGKASSINDIAKGIINSTKSKSKIVYQPERKGDIKHSLANLTETKSKLKFVPEYNLQSGLDLTIDFFKDKHL
ncbi:MAG: NAD-dependent epimerase/dehydratase [Ignavibacteria bacterium]|nr:MAG: NAD-dependent epimerase/dehydratase [Ignavibacteria bacterium]KAF0158316.1 MAG: NAD-dependent epimerase/dehydratase [Ignavibacteria bacterium]